MYFYYYVLWIVMKWHRAEYLCSIFYNIKLQRHILYMVKIPLPLYHQTSLARTWLVRTPRFARTDFPVPAESLYILTNTTLCSSYDGSKARTHTTAPTLYFYIFIKHRFDRVCSNIWFLTDVIKCPKPLQKWHFYLTISA